MDWEGYMERVRLAERTGDAALVDLVADRALSAVLRDARSDNPAVFVRSKRADLFRHRQNIGMLDLLPLYDYDDDAMPEELARCGIVADPMDTAISAEDDGAFWQQLGERIAGKLRADAAEMVLSIARLLVDGYSAEECAAQLGITKMTVSRARSRLAAIL